MATTGICRHCHQPITWIRVNANTGYWAPTFDLQHTDRPWGGCLSTYPGEGHNIETGGQDDDSRDRQERKNRGDAQ